MECRSGYGACCIAPLILSPIPGMPDGKPMHTRCGSFRKITRGMCLTPRKEVIIYLLELEQRILP